MKRRKKKMSRVVSLILAAAMIVTSLPQGMLTVSAAEVSDAAVFNEALSETGTQGSGASENGVTEGETSGEDSSKDGITEGDSSGDNALGEDPSEGDTLDGENPDNGTSDEGKADDETSDEGKSEDDTQEKDKTEGETSEDGDASGEDDGKEDAGQEENGESQDGEDEGEEAGSVDSDNAERLDSEELLLDGEEEEKEPIRIYLGGDSEYYTVYDEDGNDITQQYGFTVPYGSSEKISFRIVPKAGYVVIMKKNDLSWAGMELSTTEINGECECTISPIDEEIGYIYEANIWINTTKKARYKLTFVYSSADVDELVLTNSPEDPAQQVGNNEPVLVTNEYNTSFKLKAKAGKSLAVSYESEDGENHDGFYSYYEDAGNGYYNFDLGNVYENAIITIKDGWKITFDYNDDEIEELYRHILVGNEEDLIFGDAWFNMSNMINHTEVVAKGEVFYFGFYTEEYYMCDRSITDNFGNTIEWISGGEGGSYRVVPTADMTIKIKFTPRTLPVTFVDGVVENIRITAKDEGGEPYDAYDEEKKEMINIHSDMTEYNISFEIAAGKHFDRVELVDYTTWYEDGELQYEYYYEKIDVEKNDDGTYSSVESFCLYTNYIELRIIADDAYVVEFVPSDEVEFYAHDDYRMSNALSGEITIVKDYKYGFKITLDMEYELATPYVIAESNGETYELEVGERHRTWHQSEDKEIYVYDCSITPTADTKISVSIKQKSIPFKYDKNALKNIEIGETSNAKLSEDGESININSYKELPGCEIKFTLEEDKAIIGAYYGYTGRVWNENGEWTSETRTYTEYIQVNDEEKPLYTITLDIPEFFDENRIISIDYIQIVAGDKCEISFEGHEGKAEIIDFNSYGREDHPLDNEQPVEAVKNGEYLFRVGLFDDYNAAALHIETEDGKELPVKYYYRQEPNSENRAIQYYSFTPTEDASKVNIDLTPLSIPISYTDSAVKNLVLTQYDEETPEYAPVLSADKKTVNVWSYDYGLPFDLELESGSTLSRIFSRRSNVDDFGNKIDGYYEEDIPYYIVDDKYHFDVSVLGYEYRSNLLEIEIVTNKVNLSACNVELDLEHEYVEFENEYEDKKGYECYYTPYIAKEIEPKVTVTYEVDEDKIETLNPNEYIVTYKNNRNVGEAYVTITAKEDSSCTGSNSANFEIRKAQAPAIEPLSISVDVNDNIKEGRELNLSNRVLVDTALGEKGVKPISYNVDLYDNDYTKGGVLANDPDVSSLPQDYWDDENKEWKAIWTHTLIYSINEGADATSEKAVIVLTAYFENYDDAKVVIEVSMAAKETIILDGYALNRSKKYDAKPYSYDYENLYVVDENGSKREDSDDIMAALKGSIKFHYKGNEYISQGWDSRPYDSYEAPVNAGSYTLTVELSEENKDYTAASYEVGYFNINRREIYIRPEPVTISVGDTLPDKYDYNLTGDSLLDGDTMIPEPTISCDLADTNTAGKYKITVDADGVDICNKEGESVIHNYSIHYYDNWLTISTVVKTEITLSHKTGTSLTKVYDGVAFDGISLIEARNDETLIEDAKITVKYVGRENTVYTETTNVPVNVGTYTMKAKVDSTDGQYKSEEKSFDIEITKATAPALSEKGINVQPVTEDTPGTLDLTQYLSGYDVESYGTVTIADESEVLTGDVVVSSQGVLSYTLKANAATGTALLTIPLVFRNYDNADLKVKITLTSKTPLTLSKAAGVDVDREYNGSKYVLPQGAVTYSGIPQGETAQPKLDYAYTSREGTTVEPIDAGLYTVIVTVADDDENYVAQGALEIDFEITRKTVNIRAKDGEWDKTLGGEHPTSTEYLHGYEAEGFIDSKDLESGPASYTYTYISGEDTITLQDTDDWDALEADTIITVTPSGAQASDNYIINYVPGTLTVTDKADGEEFIVDDIETMVYTGSQLKPKVTVKVRTNSGFVELSAKDYKVTYSDNINAGTGKITITGKGNYDKEITKPFTIEKASIGNGSENTALGITLKYTDQSLDTKASKLVTSLKYKKALKEGTDFTVTLTKADAPDGTAPVSKTEGTTPAKTPTGTDKAGAYTLLIKPMDNSNYSGYIEKTVYIADKTKLLKNAKITIKTKTLKWDDKDTGNYDKDNWGGFYLIPGSSKDDAKDFTVSMGKTYLTNGQTGVNDKDADKSQYFISYTNNDQTGTATITVTGDGTNYIGTKSATFKIQGTAFKAGTKAGNIKLPDTLTAPESYTGEEITKALGSLEIVGKTDGTKLAKDVDYTVTHSNNVKKGNATVIITAKPESGYTGSIKKTFKIQAADLKKAIKSASGGNAELKSGTDGSITGIEYKDPVSYSKSGATISGLVFKNEAGTALKLGTDYTVKYTYTDKKDKKAGSSAKMTLKGKGNYSGTVDVEFTIGKAAYSDLEVSVAPVKLGNKALKPKVTVKDGKKALTVSEDGKKEVKVTYANNEPDKVQAWLTWLASGSTEETEPAAPTVTIEITNNANYEQTSSDTRTLNIYKDKLDKNKLTINWSDTTKTTDFTYNNGEQVKPGITSISYDNKFYTVRAAGKDYYAYDSNNVEIFKITYGANNKSGKKAGSVTIEGLRLYGGKYTEKFEISRKDIGKN